MSTDTLLTSIVDRQRQINQLEARQLADIATFAAESVSARGAPKELSLALRIMPHRAAGKISLAQELATRLPNTFAAMLNGDLDSDRATKIAEPTAALTDEQARKVDDIMAKRLHGKDPKSLRRSANAAVRKVDPDGADRRATARRRNRKLQLSHEEDGMASLFAYLPAEIAASIYARVDRIARRLKEADDTRTLDEIRADVFADLCLRDETGRKVPPKAEIFVYMDFWTYLGLNNKPAEMAGHGLIPAWLANQIANRENSVIRRVITDPLTGRPIDCGRERYRPRAATDEFARIRDRECRSPGCHRPAQACDLDHVQDWAKDGATNDQNLCGLCKADHNLKDEPGWHYRLDEDGTLNIETPAGRTYTSQPEPFHAPRPKPDYLDDDEPPPPF